MFNLYYKYKIKNYAKKLRDLNKTKLQSFNTFNEATTNYKEFNDLYNESLYYINKVPNTHITSIDNIYSQIEKHLNEIYNENIIKALNSPTEKECLNKLLIIKKDLDSSYNKGFDNYILKYSNLLELIINNSNNIYNNYNKEKSNKDLLFNEVIKYILSTNKVSATLIQRRFNIGYNKASKIIETLEEKNIIGPSNGTNPREILIKSYPNINTKEIIDFITLYSNNKETINSNNINYLSYIDNDMNGFDFEKLTGKLLEANGFTKVEVTKCSNDFGVDVIAYKDDVKYAIQCKKYSSPVGIKAVQEVIGSKTMNDCHVGVVLTNNTFTKSAIELAKKNNIFLWDRNKLIELMKNINE